VASARAAADLDITFTLDEAELKQRRAANARRVHTVQIPLIRAIGFVILCAIVLLRDGREHAPHAPEPGLLLLVAVNLGYAALSWLTLRALYGRTGRLDLSLLFLHLDVLVWLPNLHNLEQSHLFFAYFLLVRVADQVGFGFRRAFYFVHVVVVAYLAYTAWQALGEPDARTAERLAIAVTMYLVGGYLAFTGSVTERLRNRTRQAVRTARELVTSLEQKTAALEEQAAELEQARRAAEQASVAKSQFLTTISHEIRTPLNGVLGTTELLLDTPLSPAQRRFVQTAHRSATSLLALINDVLDLSRIEAGKLTLHQRVFDLRALLQEAVDLVATVAADKPVSVGCRVPLEVPETLEGDPLRLRQLLVNLLHNAVKFTDEGQVVLEVSVLEDRPAEVRLAFEVRDTGIGIEADQVDSMFDAFVQADGSNTRRHRGSGLGLAIVRQLADLMGGRVHVQSRPGQGSAFSFEVSLKKTSDALLTTEEQAIVRARAGAHVLLAEDDAVNQLVVVEMLKKLDCFIDVVSDGRAACSSMDRRRYDVVLMDCQMPGMDGFEATRRIRSAERGTGRRVPIIALTADALSGSRERCLASGMDDYLTKPVSFGLLRDTLERWTRGAVPAED
jgi:signal transduction histidine kinase